MEKTHAQEADIRAFRSQVEDIRAQIAREIVGQQEVVDHMLMALIAGGNVLFSVESDRAVPALAGVDAYSGLIDKCRCHISPYRAILV